MKRLFAFTLVQFLLLPICGSVLASSANIENPPSPHHFAGLTESMAEMAPEPSMVGEGAPCEHSHVGESTTLACCWPNHFHSFIGLPESRPTEKPFETARSPFFLSGRPFRVRWPRIFVEPTFDGPAFPR